MSELPKQVKEAAENAERLLQQQQPKPQEQEELPKVETGGAEPLPEPPKEEPRQPDKTDWKAKYLVLQGKYNAEVPRLAAENRELKAEGTSLKDKLVAAEQTIAELRKQGEAKKPGDVDAAVEQIRTEYGTEVASAIERLVTQKATEKAAEIAQPLRGKVEQLESEREEARNRQEAEQKRRDFSEAVNDLVPDWEQIDQLPEFHEFLAEIGSDGHERQVLLNEAAGRFDAAGAARIFAAFKRTDAYQKRHGTKPQPKGREALAAQVVPEAAGREPAQTKGKVWTRVEVTEFYRDLAMGRKYSPERAKEIERDIEAAYREGRVR